MFTGIVEAVGTVASIREMSEARELRVEAPDLAPELAAGDSIAVDGACLTVVESDASSFVTEVIGTTLSRTIAIDYVQGAEVNLERAVQVGERLDGHFVQGHVDGVGEVLSVRPSGDYRLIDLALPGPVAEVTILHGSISVNGVSLTVNDLPRPGRCQVGIIPYTWAHTNFHALGPGHRVNLEGDLIGKYVGKLLSSKNTSEAGPGLDLERLEEMGY